MKIATLLVSFAALAFAGAPAFSAQEPKAQARAEIPFVDHGGIWNWTAGENDRVVYLQDSHRQWYKATLFMSAFDLPFANAIRVDAGPTGTLDRWGAIYVGRQRYPIQSLEKVDRPPAKPQKHTKIKDLPTETRVGN